MSARIDAEWMTAGIALGGLIVRILYYKAIAISRRALGRAKSEAENMLQKDTKYPKV